MIGLSMFDIARRGRERDSALPLPPISAVAADGWRSTMPVPVDLALAPIAVLRPGFSTGGEAILHARTLRTTKRVRQAYPNQAALTSDTVALSDYVYATDTIAGVSNNSAEISPKPIAAWGMADRRLVGDALTVRCVAFHRDGRAGAPVACVIFSATDGSATVTATVATLSATPDPLTGNVVCEYVATLDLSELADNVAVTVNARVYPWLGGLESVLDSADQAGAWQFGPRVFRRNAARATAPYIVLVRSAGSDVSGAVDTDPSTAKAACATLTGAINRARTVLGPATGALDGVEFWLDAGTWSRSASPTANAVNAAIVIRPMPGVAKADCIVQFGAANTSFNVAYLRVQGLALQRTASFYLHSQAASLTVIADCSLDGGNQAVVTINGAGAIAFYENTAFTNVATNVAMTATANYQPLFRGCTWASPTTAQFDGRLVLGCTFANTRRGHFQNPSGAVIAFNRFVGNTLAGSNVEGVGLATTGTVAGVALVQNIYENVGAGTATVALALSSDGGLAHTEHILCWHNTFAGFDLHGRANILYDETTGQARSHKLQSFVGNIHVQINTKSDLFKADGARTGNWAYGHGVGVRGEFSRYRDAAGGGAGFRQDYPGTGSIIGTSNLAPGLDPQFADYRATASGPAAGAGGGSYTLGALSPARAIVADSPLGFDLTGVAREGLAAAGAFA